MHTPGPWKLYEISEDDDCPQHILIGDADAEEIATIVHRAAYNPIPEYKWANARLIAAAPKLLEALEAVRERLPKSGSLDCAVIIGEAIAEAKGE